MDYNLVFHVDQAEEHVLSLALTNALNYTKALPNTPFDMVLVANGPAVTLFCQQEGPLREKAQELMETGLSIRLCNNALEKFHVPAETLWKGVDIVPAGILELVILQQKGYAYIKP